MEHKVCILDYGSGNVRSVANMFSFLKVEHVVSNEEEELRSASHLVLPGVGAFGASMQKIQDRVPLSVLEDAVLRERKPFLGICVGMQVLADVGEEFGVHRGLGWISGRVRKFATPDLPIPHVGWNDVKRLHPDSLLGEHEKLDFYFVHSYVFDGVDPDNVGAVTTHGERFPSIVRKGNIHGVQFHPEKSQKAGMMLLMNFLRQ